MVVLIVVVVIALVLFLAAFTLVRTSGDGRPALKRLHHPDKGGVQEEYGGDGDGHINPKIRNRGRYLSKR
jgi:hypothetical protein